MREPRDSRQNSGPDDGHASEKRTSMDHPDRGRAFPAGSPHDSSATAALLHWDELPQPELRALERDARHGPALDRLRAAEGFLRRTLDARPCPPAEELYDYARGPGAADLSDDRRAELEDHVAHCAPCTRWTASLASAPPPPLEIPGAGDLGTGDLAEDLAEDRAGSSGPFAGPASGPTVDPMGGPPAGEVADTAAEPLRRMRWLPVAAAAAVLVGGYGLFQRSEGVGAATWPARPLLRTTGDQPLWFPRGPVLAGGIALSGGAPTFEFAGVEGAESVRVRVLRHDGGAFGEGTLVDEIQGFDSPLRGDERLAAGHYTWEVWARVDGLDRLIGELDFRIVAAADADDAPRTTPTPSPAPFPAPAPTLEDLRRLHDAGFTTDARELARTLPPSPERDAYLAPPGR